MGRPVLRHLELRDVLQEQELSGTSEAAIVVTRIFTRLVGDTGIPINLHLPLLLGNTKHKRS